MTVKLGMCGFTIAADPYAVRFPVVEVQQTFYDPPPLARLVKWRARAPEDFEFTMKAWQVITHLGRSSTYRRLRRPFSDVERAEAGAFRVNATTLAAWKTTGEACAILRATAILFQCPASFRPTPDNVDALKAFFGAIERPARVRFLWEPRGPWPDDVVLGVCRALGLVHAVDPFVRPSLTPEFVYWRLHGNGSAYASYTDEELDRLATWLPADPDVETYVLFNNIPRVRDIARFQERLAKRHLRLFAG